MRGGLHLDKRLAHRGATVEKQTASETIAVTVVSGIFRETLTREQAKVTKTNSVLIGGNLERDQTHTEARRKGRGASENLSINVQFITDTYHFID